MGRSRKYPPEPLERGSADRDRQRSAQDVTSLGRWRYLVVRPTGLPCAGTDARARCRFNPGEVNS